MVAVVISVLRWCVAGGTAGEDSGGQLRQLSGCGQQGGDEDGIDERFEIGIVGFQAVEPSQEQNCTGHFFEGNGIHAVGQLTALDSGIDDRPGQSGSGWADRPFNLLAQIRVSMPA